MIKIKGLIKIFVKYDFTLECRHLDIDAGSSLGISGESGSGKTLFTKTLAGLTGSYTGSVEIAMTELRNTYKRKIGYLPFRNVLYGNLTLKEMSNFLLSQYKAKPEEFELKIEWFAKFWDLKPFVSRRLSTLTDGQLQTVKFFISMLHSPSVLIIDEPFNGLGSGSTEKIRELFTDIQNRQVTVLATSSSPELITRITERQAIISKGRVE